MSFWNKLKKPIIGLAPMDGVTDAAFRYIVDKLGKPSVMFTEFVPVEAIKANAERVLDAFVTHSTDTPLVAQLYGTDLEAYYLSTLVICELGFDGVDINMGCPAKSVQARGAGAGLIKNPKLAKEIIKTVKKAVSDYTEGRHSTHLIQDKIKKRVEIIKRKSANKNGAIAVSVKTRIGYEKNIAQEWATAIAMEKPDCITFHGRTYAQMYRGMADWQAISAASRSVKEISDKIVFLGNGDVNDVDNVDEICSTFGVDGVLIARGALGNPWLFSEKNKSEISKEEIFEAMMLHAKKFLEFYPNGHFLALRKHMMWYASCFDRAKKMHSDLQKIRTYEELEEVINNSRQ